MHLNVTRWYGERFGWWWILVEMDADAGSKNRGSLGDVIGSLIGLESLQRSETSRWIIPSLSFRVVISYGDLCYQE